MSTLYINLISEGFKIAIREKKLSPSRNQRIEKSSVKSYRQLRQLLTTTLRHAPKKYIKKGITHYQAAINLTTLDEDKTFVIFRWKTLFKESLGQSQNTKQFKKKNHQGKKKLKNQKID